MTDTNCKAPLLDSKQVVLGSCRNENNTQIAIFFEHLILKSNLITESDEIVTYIAYCL